MRPRTLALSIFSVMALVAWLGLTGCAIPVTVRHYTEGQQPTEEQRIITPCNETAAAISLIPIIGLFAGDLMNCQRG